MGVDDEPGDVRAVGQGEQCFLDKAPDPLAQVVARDIGRHVVLEGAEDAERTGFGWWEGRGAMPVHHLGEPAVMRGEHEVGAWEQRRAVCYCVALV
jgi:hypothetical protein